LHLRAVHRVSPLYSFYTIARWISFPDLPAGFILISLAGIFIGIITLTGVSSYFFHSAPVADGNAESGTGLSYYPSGLLIPGVSVRILRCWRKLTDLLGNTRLFLWRSRFPFTLPPTRE